MPQAKRANYHIQQNKFETVSFINLEPELHYCSESLLIAKKKKYTF